MVELNQNHSANNKLFYLIIFFLSLVALIIGIVVSNKNVSSIKITNEQINKVDNIEKQVNEIKKDLTPYEYKDNLIKTLIISNFINTVKDGKQSDSFSKTLITKGKFNQGYLYIKASVNNLALSKDDDIYLKISGFINGKYQEIGGHLINNKSLKTPLTDKYSELLFDLSDVKYKSTYKMNDSEAVSGDWLGILNNSSSNLVIGFSSTLGNGKIEELSFYYNCVKDADCLLSTN